MDEADEEHKDEENPKEEEKLEEEAPKEEEDLFVVPDDRVLLNVQNVDGDFPLHTAIRNGNVDCVQMLLDNGAEVNLTNHKGQTPLHLAAEVGKLCEVGLLVQHPSIRYVTYDLKGMTPFHVALSSYNHALVPFLAKYFHFFILKLLIQRL